ncbi:MAG: hypothetical protein LBN34_04905 [Clostridiales Family XIII bacterium]|nr:hypothetical protein [Clostridiales Family XIII bacterium]
MEAVAFPAAAVVRAAVAAAVAAAAGKAEKYITLLPRRGFRMPPHMTERHLHMEAAYRKPASGFVGG